MSPPTKGKEGGEAEGKRKGKEKRGREMRG